MDKIYKKYNYPSAYKFYKILKDEGLTYTMKQVNEFIKNQNVAQLHKVSNKNRNTFKNITAHSPNEIFQIDLLDYTKYSRTNKGYKWILICVDIFTRKAFAIPMKDKTTKMTEQAFKKIIDDNKPKVIFHDMGSEFKGSFHKFIKSQSIIDISNDFKNHNALGIIDRLSRTLKTMISKHMTASGKTKWVDALPQLINIYNNTSNAGIQNLKPNSVENDEDSKIQIATLNFEKEMKNKNLNDIAKSKIKVGDYVRIKIEKGTFTKGYEITFSPNVYRVEKIEGTTAIVNNTKYPISKLMVVPPSSLDINTIEKDNLNKDSRTKRRLNKEGIQDYLNAGKYYM